MSFMSSFSKFLGTATLLGMTGLAAVTLVSPAQGQRRQL